MTGPLILVRHGQSQTNADGLFTGLPDVPLTPVGRAEAERCAELLNEAELMPAAWFCSPRLRARQTVEILHQLITRPSESIEHDRRLAQRNDAALTGLSENAVPAEHGLEQCATWRRSVDATPPPMGAARQAALGSADPRLGRTEALRDVIRRVDAAWTERIAAVLRTTGSVLVIAHGNALRVPCTVPDRLDDTTVEHLNTPADHPLVYRVDDGGNPLDPGGRYLDQETAATAAAAIALEGGT